MKPVKNLFSLLLCSILFSATAFAQIKSNEKITPLLKNSIAQKKSSEMLTVFVSVTEFSRLHNDTTIQIIAEYKNTNTALVKISVGRLASLLAKNEVVFADVYRTPKEEVTTGSLDIALNKLSLAHNRFPTINGDSINVSIMEQRFDTTDIDIKGRFFETGTASDVQSSHAIIMATILAGVGNSSPFAKGGAWGARISSSDFTTLLPDADAVYSQNKISVQNHSYGTGIENYYGADAASYDVNVWKLPTLIHVFSSGNSGTNTSTTGAYAGIAGFANLTGSFKMAKNIITVGATDSFNTVAALSSKGPAFDGRIKPELVAFGEDGSSGAAALVSGTAALVQQAYRINNHRLPSASLVKAVLLNSADDIFEKHVDFVSGYGSLNAFAAINSVEENRFFEGTVVQGEVKSFALLVPPGVGQLKITVAWMDTAAAPNASKALVNNIDAALQLPATNEIWQPWVLSSYPNKDSLLLPAVRRRDSLNTTEQITVDNPQAGSYVVQIKGDKILTAAPQNFSIAYQFDTIGSFRWTYPDSTGILAASATNVIRWQTNIAGTGSIEFSTNGTQWQTISSSVDLSKNYFKWNTPDTISNAFLRMNLPPSSSATSNGFVISKPAFINVGFDCPDSFLLYWNKFKTNQYQIYFLGQRYLEPLQTVSDSFVVFQKQQYTHSFYSVAPLINDKPGLRSFTINYKTQGAGCYVNSFFAVLQNDNTALLTAELGTLYNVQEVAFQKISSSGVQTLKTISSPSTLNLNFTDVQLTHGANVYRLQIKLNNGNIVYSNIDIAYYLPDQPVLVYPNPISQNQSINLVAQDPGVYSILIYDANGKLIHQQTLDTVSQQIPGWRFSTGFYIIKITGNGKTFTQKLIVY
jgi:hypothetical protein